MIESDDDRPATYPAPYPAAASTTQPAAQGPHARALLRWGAAQWQAVLWSIGVPLGATLVSDALFPAREPTNHLIVYLIGVLFVASRFGFWPSAAAALLSVLASDFLLIAPYFSFAVARPQDGVTLGVFLLAALLASRLTANLRSQGESARQRELRVRFLYEFTRALAGARTEEEVASIAAGQISRELPWQCDLLLANADGRLAPAPDLARSAGESFDPAIAQWAYEQRRPAGRGTAAMSERRELYFPVSSPTHRFGMLLLRPTRLSLLLPEQRRLIETVLSLISQAIERIRLARQVQSATVQAETEALRNSLLSAIAHDFRTPLASIVAAADTLLQDEARLSREKARELAETIRGEGQRMTRLANNTLEMARLEAGSIRLERDWYPLEEIIGAALSPMDLRLRAHPVRSQLPDAVALAQVDVVMIVRVLQNLIENAINYTPLGTPIHVAADVAPGLVRFCVADEGAGLAAGEEDRIFEKFYRGAGRTAQVGVGLGLTICRIIVQAHGGRITARNRREGGAEFSFTIPQPEAPPRLVPEETQPGQLP
jgi:two-component system sensor histidine kinase KdpD